MSVSCLRLEHGCTLLDGGDRKLTVTLPAAVLRQLRARTVVRDTTIRALLLEALAAAGYAVPEAEIRDRRRPPPDSVHRSRRRAGAGTKGP